MELAERIQRGREAAQIHPMIEKFFEEFRASVVRKWESSTDPEVREELHRQLGAARALKLQIASYITDGRLAEEKMEETSG